MIAAEAGMGLYYSLCAASIVGLFGLWARVRRYRGLTCAELNRALHRSVAEKTRLVENINTMPVNDEDDEQVVYLMRWRLRRLQKEIAAMGSEMHRRLIKESRA